MLKFENKTSDPIRMSVLMFSVEYVLIDQDQINRQHNLYSGILYFGLGLHPIALINLMSGLHIIIIEMH